MSRITLAALKSRLNKVLQVGHWSTVTRVSCPAFFSGFTGPWQQHDVFELPYSFANTIGLVKWRFNKARSFLFGAAAWPFDVGPKPPSPHRTQTSPRTPIEPHGLWKFRIVRCVNANIYIFCMRINKQWIASILLGTALNTMLAM